MHELISFFYIYIAYRWIDVRFQELYASHKVNFISKKLKWDIHSRFYMPVSFNIFIFIEISSLIFSRLIIRSDNDFSFLIINLEDYF